MKEIGWRNLAILESEKQDGLSFFRMLPWAKMVTWSLIIGAIYSLHSLFAVIFITFVLSYICRNFVKLVYSPFGNRPYVRKIIVVATFLLLLFGFYLGGRFLVPNIIEQGKQVVTAVKELRLHQDFGNAIPNLLASARYYIYENSDLYEEEFKEFQEKIKDPEGLQFRNFQEKAKKLRETFRDDVLKAEGTKILATDQDTEEYKDAFANWLDNKFNDRFDGNKTELLAKREIAEKEERKGPGQFSRFRKNFATDKAWSGYLKSKIIDHWFNEYQAGGVVKEEYDKEFEDHYRQSKGEEAVNKLQNTDEWEERFKSYYEEKKEQLELGIALLYDQFIKFESAQSQEEFQKELGGGDEEGSSDENAAVALFAEEMHRKFFKTFKESSVMQELNKNVQTNFLPEVAAWATNTIQNTIGLLFQLIIAVFLSFFIVWDIPRLKGMIKRLETSRIGNFYREVAPGLVNFGWLMGRAFQAQAIIAVMNTALTLSAMTLLDIPHRTFLSSIVFICSFIPVAGVVISSIPLVVVSIQMPDGILVALQVIGCILIIHFLETTLLNPKVMGDMLKLHPLLVLVILLLGEHFFGVWGLLLGVPIAVYIFRFVILRQTPKPRLKKTADPPPPPQEAKA